MKKEEAYSILGLDLNASEDDVKKKYRELSKKYHPDVCKEPDANDNFKRINDAFTRIKNHDFETEQQTPFTSNGFSGFNHGFDINDLFNGFAGNYSPSRNVNLTPISINIVISFKESVFGCKKSISYHRKNKCNTCNGIGKKTINNGCKTCGGKGKTVTNRGNVFIQSTCTSCFGRSQTEPCQECNNSGTIGSDVDLLITVPAGIQNGNILRLGGMGHFLSSNGIGDRHSDVYVHVQVIQDSYFKIEGQDVVSYLNISLLEAIEGTKKVVNTLDGEHTVDINPLSKNKDEIIISNLGLERMGNQRVILQVEYPDKIQEIIQFLKEN